MHFERIQTSKPQSFWREINKLGPIRAKKIPMEVLGHDGNLVNELAQIIKRWEIDFKGLLCDDTSSLMKHFTEADVLQKPCKSVRWHWRVKVRS